MTKISFIGFVIVVSIMAAVVVKLKLEVKQPHASAALPPAYHWQDDKPEGDSIYCQHYDYVRNSDRRIMATVDHFRSFSTNLETCNTGFTVWHNGAGYGDFLTLVDAQRRAEDIVAKYGESTF